MTITNKSLVFTEKKLPSFNFDTFNLGNLGTIEAYISAVNKLPIISAEEEIELARNLRDSGDLFSARKLVLSHLRLVVSIARQYLGYGLPHADLIQEGNIGLMKAIRRFDPERGVRLMSFAVHWIKAEIHEFVIKNWRLVKIATTKAQRKIFFNLRSMTSNNNASLNSDQVGNIAKNLNVRLEDVREMETRLSGYDMSLDGYQDDDDKPYPISYLSDDKHGPETLLEQNADDLMKTKGLQDALNILDSRSRRIVESRWLKDDSGPTLHDLAKEFNVSAERIRQIESAAMKKMRSFLLNRV
ncbi:RNA polymerase sigma-32 factor [Candidatus Kinetoplastibacterium desouzaii TCC079E]|uniref:RNA polymerase sigma factor n=1 Tax=Candidatus Kinetoplastidibacterium desouzai TCC079E TaxID=1208919 RepID=M1M2R5_9PROT|nr:RNA polymerase sigma factor RpoH [Candidatus Kinetoplastibacterium desouzaii]AGF46595.1 RNA polymerase sigma-32 factor [Candidatus Kinetoplastibacterium desouzaii TCC079E]